MHNEASALINSIKAIRSDDDTRGGQISRACFHLFYLFHLFMETLELFRNGNNLSII